jgi:hypothetical protein
MCLKRLVKRSLKIHANHAGTIIQNPFRKSNINQKNKKDKKYTIWLFNIAMENHHAINIIGKPSINNQRVIIKHQKNKSITLW